jgi:RNA polymerase sigma-70 factor (ECF subfamily)
MSRSNADRAAVDLSVLTDEQLMEHVVRGERGAFDLLVQRHKARLYSYLMRMLRDPHEAEDVTQEAFVRAYVHAAKYRNIAKFSTWLYTIATNLVRNRVRKHKTAPSFLSLAMGRGGEDGDEREPLELPDPGDLPDRAVEKSEMQALIAQGIERIPARYREAFVLREIQQFSYEEIAAVTGLKLGTVRSRINRGRSHFRDLMQPVMRRLGALPAGPARGAEENE